MLKGVELDHFYNAMYLPRWFIGDGERDELAVDGLHPVPVLLLQRLSQRRANLGFENQLFTTPYSSLSSSL